MTRHAHRLPPPRFQDSTSEPQGITLGRFMDEQRRVIGEKLIYQRDRHAFVIGPNGVGKGTRFLSANLLGDSLNDRSVIVFDMKGEQAAITAKHRHEMGHDVKVLDPFGTLKDIVSSQPDVYRYLIHHGLTESCGFNPLDGLDSASPVFYDHAASLGHALIDIEGKDPHWSSSSQGLVVGGNMWVKKKKGKAANLEDVRLLLTEAERTEHFKDADGRMTSRLVSGLRANAAEMVMEGGFEISSLAGRFLKETDEIASIQSTADTQTRWMLSGPLRADLKKPGGIDWRQLNQRPSTVYVILPAQHFGPNAVWLRLVIVSALNALYRAGGIRTVILIDEMAALGPLKPLADAIGLVRGYGVQIVGVLQDLAQLESLYKERWESFLANAGAILCFAPNDLKTADWMSRRSGQATVFSESISTSSNASAGGMSEGQSISRQPHGRALYLPHELMGLDEGTALAWIAGMSNHVRVFAPSYWQIAQCARRALPNPYYQPAPRN